MDIESILKRYSQLKSYRTGYWESLWREVRKYCYPNEQTGFSEGGERGNDILDTTACRCRSRLAAGMFAWMAPPDQKWFELAPANREIAEDDEVKIYFSKVSSCISEALANSNWPTVLVNVLNELACGMDGIVFCEDTGKQDVLNFRHYKVEDLCYVENAYGQVDTVFVEKKMTAAHMAELFGEEALPEKIKANAADPARQDTEHTVLQAVLPRKKRDLDMADGKNMPFADIYIEMESHKLLYEGGFQENPFAVCRFEKNSGEHYGRGPGVNLLPDIRMMNRIVASDILGTEHLADPSYVVPDGSLVDDEFNKDPGAVIMVKNDFSGNRPEQLPYHFNPAFTAQKIERLENIINDGFFLDIFNPLGDMRNMTATEAEIRNEGKIIPFAPIAGNVHSELFKVVIHRVFGILFRRGKLPPMPQKLLAAPEYKIEFVSKIARALRKIDVLGWMQTEASIAGIVQMVPQVADNFDFDKIVRDMAIINGTKPEWLTPEEERNEGRAAAAQAQAQQNALNAMISGASALGSNAGKAPEDGSPLGMIMSGQGV